MTTRGRRKARLGMIELAVDPADVDQVNYPVRIRLTRPLTSFEVEVLAAAEPGVRTEGDAIVVPDARLDDIARAHDAWSERLERVESVAEELEGAAWLADQRRGCRAVEARVAPGECSRERPGHALTLTSRRCRARP